MTDADGNIRINRAPVLTLWAAVVAERLGFDRDTALTLGQAVADLSAYAKGVSLGIVEPKPELVREQSDRLAEGEQLRADLLGRAVPVVRTPDGLRAVNKGKPGNPTQIAKYLAGKFGARLECPASDGRAGGGLRAGRPLPSRVPAVRAVPAGRARGRIRVGCAGAGSGEGASAGAEQVTTLTAARSSIACVCSSVQPENRPADAAIQEGTHA
jgi:hypothetical protein